MAIYGHSNWVNTQHYLNLRIAQEKTLVSFSQTPPNPPHCPDSSTQKNQKTFKIFSTLWLKSRSSQVCPPLRPGSTGASLHNWVSYRLDQSGTRARNHLANWFLLIITFTSRVGFLGWWVRVVQIYQAQLQPAKSLSSPFGGNLLSATNNKGRKPPKNMKAIQLLEFPIPHSHTLRHKNYRWWHFCHCGSTHCPTLPFHLGAHVTPLMCWNKMRANCALTFCSHDKNISSYQMFFFYISPLTLSLWTGAAAHLFIPTSFC